MMSPHASGWHLSPASLPWVHPDEDCLLTQYVDDRSNLDARRAYMAIMQERVTIPQRLTLKAGQVVPSRRIQELSKRKIHLGLQVLLAVTARHAFSDILGCRGENDGSKRGSLRDPFAQSPGRLESGWNRFDGILLPILKLMQIALAPLLLEQPGFPEERARVDQVFIQGRAVEVAESEGHELGEIQHRDGVRPVHLRLPAVQVQMAEWTRDEDDIRAAPAGI